jgi:ERCC4-type nuclease
VCKADCIAPKYLLRRKLGANALPQELQEANDQRLHDRKDFLTVIASLPQTTLVVRRLAHVLLQFFHGFVAVQRATKSGSQLVLVDGIAEAAAYLIQNFRRKLLNHQIWKTGIFKLRFGLRGVFHLDIP